MSDDFEDARIFLELCYFTVSLITDQNSPIQFFKSDFVVLMQPLISKFVQQLFPNPTDRSVLMSQSYRKLVQTYVSKIKPLIDALKTSGLWIPQGTASASVDPTDLISPVLSAETIDVEQLLLLRAVKINQLLYSPELSLYFNACLHGCQSPIVIIRLYSYSLLRSAPIIVDLRHLFVVIKEAVGIWEAGSVSFEFSAAFYLLLTRFSEHRPSIADENEYNLILQMLINLHDSSNFETLMCFDPTLAWLFSIFSREMIQAVYSSALTSLQNGHSGDFCIICHCLSVGIGNPSIFLDATKAAFSSISMWAHPIQKETRAKLATLPLCCPQSVTQEVISVIADQLQLPKESSEPCLYIFAQFLAAYYLGTNAPLHLPLLSALIGMSTTSERKRNLPIDVQNIVSAICSSPVRFLQVLTSSISRPQLFAMFKSDFGWSNTLLSYLSSPQTFTLSSNTDVKAAVKMIKEKPFSNEEKEEEGFSTRLNINLPLYLTLYPKEFTKLAEELAVNVDEDFRFHVIEIFAIIALMGRSQSDCISLIDLLPQLSYQCEYSHLITLIKTACGVPIQNSTEKSDGQKSEGNNGQKSEVKSVPPKNLGETANSKLDKLQGHLDQSLAPFLIIGSASSNAAAILFEHICWNEGGLPLVIFKRLKLKPGYWFADVCSSLFISLIENPLESLVKYIEEYAKISADHLVFIGYIIFKRLIPNLRDNIVKENFTEIPKNLFYPLIHFELTPDDMKEIGYLSKKYQNILKDIFQVTVSSKTR